MFPFKIGSFITHQNMLDVCCQIETYWITTQGSVGLSVSWWSRRGYPLGISEDIKIRDIAPWRPYSFSRKAA